MIQKGDTLVESAIQYTTKVDGSGNTTRTFIGTEAEIRALQPLYRYSGYDTQVDQGPPWKLTATLAYSLLTNQQGQEPEPEAQWTLQNNSGEQDIMEADIWVSNKCSNTTKKAIRNHIANPGKNIPYILPGQSEDEKNAATLLANFILIGADKRHSNTLTVARSITVSKNYVTNWSFEHANKVWSKQTLINNTNCPWWVQILLPESTHAFHQAPGVYVNKGYLAGYPNYQTVAGNKVQISQDWIYNYWIDEYYEWM